ncbi:unnamed protein product [Periconia digitata]|uniref:Uncharacterized protein n=1 Tax=Periconia digitata TaxID=1303443 RepID=A0A9W4XXY0_9PLEO|nr:unnamed protein product [Periconia digitata]
MSESLEEQQYEAASDAFDEEDMEECIRLAKQNLTEPDITSYYFMQNCILLAIALEDWNEGEEWHRTAEQKYWTCYAKSRSRNDAATLEDLKGLKGLKQLREDLDGLKEYLEHMKLTNSIYREDAEAVAETENEVEEAADRMVDLALAPAKQAP